jgi:hypothetical protein
MPHVYPVRNNALRSAAGLIFRIILAGFNAPPEFLTGFTVLTPTHLKIKQEKQQKDGKPKNAKHTNVPCPLFPP